MTTNEAPASINSTVLTQFENALKDRYLGLEVRFKDESLFQRILGKIVGTFNPDYMTHYITTIGRTVYFPNKSHYESRPSSSVEILAHESVHVYDFNESKIKFVLSYLFPQILSLPLILAYLVFGGLLGLPCLLAMAGGVIGGLTLEGLKANICRALAIVALVTSIVLIGLLPSFLLSFGVFCAAPLPASFRNHWELRGYTMSMAVEYWTTGRISEKSKKIIESQFTGDSYYRMSWSADNIVRQIDESCQKIESGEIKSQDPYAFVFDFLKSRNLVVV